MAAVSVILPVYNGETYLADTVNSILMQSFTDFELIAVDDGSTDNSLNILKNISTSDDRIKVIHKKNTGVSDTRNLGILKAAGKYVCFLDSDDLLHKDFLKIMVNKAEKQNADVVFCWFDTFYKNKNSQTAVNSDRCIEEENLKSRYKNNDFDILMTFGLGTPIWNKLFRRKLLTDYNIFFDKNMKYGEDLFFSWKFFLVSRSEYAVNKKLYHYRLNPESAVNKYYPDLYKTYKSAFEDLKNFAVNNSVYDDKFQKLIDFHFVKRLPSFLRMTVRSGQSFADMKKAIEKVLNDTVIKNQLEYNFDEVVKGANKSTYKMYCYSKNRQLNMLIILGKYLELRQKLAYKIKGGK